VRPAMLDAAAEAASVMKRRRGMIMGPFQRAAYGGYGSATSAPRPGLN
jgi:hypothetical protein